MATTEFDLQTILTQLEDRLLKTEGQIFGLRAIIGALLAIDDSVAGVLRKQIEEIERILLAEIEDVPDEPTRKFVRESQALASEMLAEQFDLAKPRLIVIDGGKVDGLSQPQSEASAAGDLLQP